MNLINKLIKDDAYGIAMRRHNCKETIFLTKYPTWNYWYADPFVCTEGGKSYVFVEAMDYYKGIGKIAVAPIDDNGIGDFEIIISENFHMSFPNVFKYEGIWYMIPETCECSQLRLYKCLKFPYNWQLDSIIISGMHLVDTVVHFISKDIVLLNSFDLDSNCLDVGLLYSLKKNKVLQKIFGSNDGRAAGNIFQDNGELFRFIQNCENCYGDYIEKYRVIECTDNGIKEEWIASVKAKDVGFDVNRGITNIHTFNCDGKYEIIDFRYRKNYPLKLIARFWGYIYKKYRIFINHYDNDCEGEKTK